MTTYKYGREEIAKIIKFQIDSIEKNYSYNPIKRIMLMAKCESWKLALSLILLEKY